MIIEESLELKIKEEINKRIKVASMYEKYETSFLQDLCNRHECMLKGQEHKMKTLDSCYRKVLDYINQDYPNDIIINNFDYIPYVCRLKDLLRYSIVIEYTGFTEKVKAIMKELTDVEIRMKQLKNRFREKDYKDIISWWRDNRNGTDDFVFEIQFHTPETYKNKQIRHYIYSITREYEKDINNISQSIRENLNKAVLLLYRDCVIPENVDAIANTEE